MSDEVALRPVREDDLVMLEELTQDPEKAGLLGRLGSCPGRAPRAGPDN